LGTRRFFGLCWQSFAVAHGAAGTCRAAASVVLLGIFEELRSRAARVPGDAALAWRLAVPWGWGENPDSETWVCRKGLVGKMFPEKTVFCPTQGI